MVEEEDKDCIGEDLDDKDDYEERIERSDFDRGVDDHEITPIPHVNDMTECDEDNANPTLLNQHVTNATPVYEPPSSSFYENLEKIWLILKLLRKHLVLLGMRT